MEFHGLIQKLLLSHPCVVLPGLGAFISRDGQPQLNRFNNMLKPSSKGIFFSANVSENDGLVYNSFALLNNKTYTEAVEIISNEIESIKSYLKIHSALRFGELGTFSHSQDGVVYFMPASFTPIDKSSFGLEPIYIQPYLVADKKDTSSISIPTNSVKEVSSGAHSILVESEIDTTFEQTVTSTFSKDYQRSILWKVAAAVALITLFGLSGSKIYTYFSKGNTESASLLQNESSINDSKEIETPIQLKPSFSEELTSSIKIVKSNSENRENERKTHTLEKIKVDSHIELQNGKSGKFAVIAGSYNIQTNASESATLLIKKGLHVKMMKYGQCTLIRLILGEFDTEEDAKSLLDQVKGQLTGCGDFFVKKI